MALSHTTVCHAQNWVQSVGEQSLPLHDPSTKGNKVGGWAHTGWVPSPPTPISPPTWLLDICSQEPWLRARWLSTTPGIGGKVGKWSSPHMPPSCSGRFWVGSGVELHSVGICSPAPYHQFPAQHTAAARCHGSELHSCPLCQELRAGEGSGAHCIDPARPPTETNQHTG